MRSLQMIAVLTVVAMAIVTTHAQPQFVGQSVQAGLSSAPGIWPHLTATADSAPKRSESGTGALMPWTDRLYMVSYLSVDGAGDGTGLYEIDANLTMTMIANHSSCYANRIMHPKANAIVIGRWVIRADRKVFQIGGDLGGTRLGAVAIHLQYPDTHVYLIGMDGELFESNISVVNDGDGTAPTATQIANMVTELKIPDGEQPHFKAAHSVFPDAASGLPPTLYVTSNTFNENDFVQDSAQNGYQMGGRLGQFTLDGGWEISDHRAYYEVTGRRNWGMVTFAVGVDSASVVLRMRDYGDPTTPSSNTSWRTYRLPKASHAYDHLWQTEWPRIREVETERYLLDAHAQFYELSPLGWAGSAWGIRPVSQHLRMIPDFCSFRGNLVLGGNQVSSIFDNNLVTGQAQGGLWFGKTDDLWSFGKPRGWGGPWRNSEVSAGDTSDSYLMTGFDHKTLHLETHDNRNCVISIQIDIHGVAGSLPQFPWRTYQNVTLQGNSYEAVVFPPGFSAHWVRFHSDQPCRVSTTLHYS